MATFQKDFGVTFQRVSKLFDWREIVNQNDIAYVADLPNGLKLVCTAKRNHRLRKATITQNGTLIACDEFQYNAIQMITMFEKTLNEIEATAILIELGISNLDELEYKTELKCGRSLFSLCKGTELAFAVEPS